ncbi:MAG TPA: sigma-70 family RNA polymerase sigma factor [Levilinea sp.]|nr:sigma-70 family RNA polymerase sigma factor [Levilinea sp.]
MNRIEPNNEQEPLSLKALQSGDKIEFARLVDLYSNQIYRLALKILGDQNDAEDVLQETFIKAYRSIASFEGRSSLATWLYRIAANEALMLLRKTKPEVNMISSDGSDNDDEVNQPQQIVDWCCLPENELLSNEARRFLDEAVESLSPNLRIVFILRDIQGLSIRETAEVLKISEMAVKTRLLRGRLHLREILSGYYGEKMK